MTTDPTMKAAEKIAFGVWPQAEGYTKDNWTSRPLWIDHKIKVFAAIINQKTGLPELKARIKELEGELHTLITFSADLQQRLDAEKAELVEACQLSLTVLAEHEQYDGWEASRESEAADVCRVALTKAGIIKFGGETENL